ncbi:MAG: type II toxin-antitoxin system ParD family antitoxin [Cyanobacteria bacterium P01_E01_bin.42]
MNITLNSQQEEFIAAQLASGKFENADRVVTVALCLLEKLQEEYEEWIVETRAKLEVAAAELERGEGVDGETVVMEILEKFAKAREVEEK